MPYVDSAYLNNGMLMDKWFQIRGVNSMKEAGSLLDLAKKAGLVTTNLLQHPYQCNKQVTTWHLPDC
jgi:hypothetical protein